MTKGRKIQAIPTKTKAYFVSLFLLKSGFLYSPFLFGRNGNMNPNCEAPFLKALVWNLSTLITLLLSLGSAACVTDRNQGLNPKVVQETIVAHYPFIQKCYTSAIGKDGHAGVVKAHFIIDKNGTVNNLRLVDESLGTDRLDTCLKKEVSAISFPKPKGGVDVVVSYPFKFEADQKLTQAAIMGVLKGVNTSLCYEEVRMLSELKVKLTIGKMGKIEDMASAFDGTALKDHSPCLSRILKKQKFPKIASKSFESVSVIVTFQADESGSLEAQLSSAESSEAR